MIRAGISGTNWTGKTLTVRSFCNARSDPRIEVVSLSDYVTCSPFPMEQGQVPEASQWILQRMFTPRE